MLIGLSRSSEVKVSSGVPQGSVIGPYLFALTTASYATAHKNCQVVKYADDTTLCFPVYRSSTNNHINLEHENLLRGSAAMDLKMNSAKCKAVFMPKRNAVSNLNLSKVPLVKSMRILGVHIDSSSSWSTHIERSVKKASSRLYGIRLLKPCISSLHLKQIYYAIVRSILKYCAPLFISISTFDCTRLERLQRRFHRIMCGKSCTDECLPMLGQRRQTLAMNLLRNAMNKNHVLNNFLPNFSCRGRFILPVRRTTRRCKSFFLSACESYNCMHSSNC